MTAAETVLTLSAAEIARRIRAGTFNPVDVTEAHIQRIQQVNPKINALVTATFDSARQEAQTAAARLAQGDTDDLPPLFGVPVTIKDCWGVAGVRFTGGSWHHRDDIAADDAPVVRRLRAAGAIILGKTNLPDMCWSGETVNPVFGRTRNPRDPRYIAGGSSGGEGAIIAAGGSPLGLGSDIAGSARIPAAACGIVSLKPTAGRVPSEGHLPMIPPPAGDWNTAGPMARRVEDLALALSVLSQTPVRNFREIELTGRPVGVYIHNPIFPVTAPVASAVSQAAGALRSAGMQVTDAPALPMVRAMFTYMAEMARSGGAQAFLEALGGGRAYHLAEEIGLNLRGRGRISPEVLFFSTFVNVNGHILGAFGYAGQERLQAQRDRFLTAMRPGGVLLTPLLLHRVPRHGWGYWAQLAPPYSLMFNALGFPAAVVPVGWDDRGLPLVVQVVAGPGEDEVALAVAATLEQVFGGWRLAEV